MLPAWVTYRNVVAIVRMACRSVNVQGLAVNDPERVAKDAYEVADAMDAERRKGGDEFERGKS